MKPQQDCKVEVFFRNGLKIIGTVQSWSDTESVLNSDGHIVVITNTLEDVFLYRILSTSVAKEIKSVTNSVIDKLSDKIEESKSKPIKTIDDIKSIAELKVQYIEEERKAIKEKLSNHEIKEVRPVEYVLPNFFKKSSTIESPTEETTRKTSSDNSIVQALLGKKDSKRKQ